MSPDDKKDLTRIEDLGEFVHDLNNEEENFLPPDIPSDEDEVPPFEESESTLFGESFDEEVPLFENPEEEVPSFEAPAEEKSSFTLESAEDSSFHTADETPETSYENTDFSAEDSPASSEGESSDYSFDESINADAPTETEEKPIEASDQWSLGSSEEETAVSSPVEEEISIAETAFESFKESENSVAETFERTEEFKAPENFQDLKTFSESSSFSGMAAEGNPSFSVLLKNVRYLEDVNDIVALMRELNLLADSEEQTKSRLMRGMLLIPRISEYAAILLAHKLRRFDIDIQVGLSDEIHPPKHQETPETGIVSKASLYQNQTHQFTFDNPKIDISQIIIAATQVLDGYQVIRYMGVASEHKMLDSAIVEEEGSEEIPRHYQDLANKLKAHALKNHSNAVVGLNYQLTPIPGEFGVGGHKYRLTCTGNLVWVNKL